jgi:hypothetical protein
MSLRLPDESQRLAVIGRTGTGKTVAGLWHLLQQFKSTALPWVVHDTKRDKELKRLWKIGGTRISLTDPPPKKPGLYYTQPLPHEASGDAMEAFHWRVHQRGGIGIFLDEGYAFDKYSNALVALYTQGRTLRIPMITLSQKPKYLNQFTWSEADFFQVFMLNDKADRKRIAEFVPPLITHTSSGRVLETGPGERLRDHHSLWYDVGSNQVVEFSPVPAPALIFDEFASLLRRQHRAI